MAGVLLITGPGGSGKSTLAEQVAGRLGWECVSEDDHWVSNGWGHGLRTVEQERTVQAQVATDVLSAIRSGRGVVLELILYKPPPNPLTEYQQVLADNSVVSTTVALKPTVEEILDRMQRRGRPGDLASLETRRTEVEHQVRLLESGAVDPAWIIDSTQMTVDALCHECQDRVALTSVRTICLAFDGVEEATLQDRPLFRVGRRRFALFNGSGSPSRPRWNDSGRSLHFLVDPLELDALREDERFTPSPHHGDRGWMALRLDAAVDWAEVAELLESAHRQVRPTPRPS